MRNATIASEIKRCYSNEVTVNSLALKFFVFVWVLFHLFLAVSLILFINPTHTDFTVFRIKMFKSGSE